MNLPDFLIQDSAGVIRICGHRLRLIDIATRYEEGLSAEGICEYYDALGLPLIYKLVAFYLENESEVQQLISKDQTAFEQLDARTPSGPSLAELRRRLRSRQEAGAK